MLWRGYKDVEGRPRPGPAAIRGHVATMHVDNALDDRKPEARRAFASGGVRGTPLEAAEQSSQILGRQAGAFVGDADDGAVLLATHHYRYLAADRTVFDGVADDIVDRLPHPVGIAHCDEIRRRRHRDSLLLVCGQRLIGIDDFVD